MSELNLGTLYDFNKNAMANEPPLDKIILNKKVKEVVNDMFSQFKYIMLLSNERRDYTVFIIEEGKSTIDGFYNDLLESLENRGKVIAIDKQPAGEWEIWVRDFETNEDIIYYLFNYNFGVVEVE